MSSPVPEPPKPEPIVSAAQPPQDPASSRDPSGGRPWWKRWWVIVLASVFAVGIIANLASGDSSGSQRGSSSAAEDPGGEDSDSETQAASDKPEAPDVVGMTLDEARKLLDGFEVTEIDASGDGRSVWDASNWTVVEQDADGTSVTLHISNERDGQEREPEVATSGGVTAFDAQIACERYADQEFAYGVRMHWIVGRLAEEYLAEQDQWFLKVEATVTNAFGAKQRGVVECYVTGSSEHPEVVDFLYY
jgi:hypothetical protein